MQTLIELFFAFGIIALLPFAIHIMHALYLSVAQTEKKEFLLTPKQMLYWFAIASFVFMITFIVLSMQLEDEIERQTEEIALQKTQHFELKNTNYNLTVQIGAARDSIETLNSRLLGTQIGRRMIAADLKRAIALWPNHPVMKEIKENWNWEFLVNEYENQRE